MNHIRRLVRRTIVPECRASNYFLTGQFVAIMRHGLYAAVLFSMIDKERAEQWLEIRVKSQEDERNDTLDADHFFEDACDGCLVPEPLFKDSRDLSSAQTKTLTTFIGAIRVLKKKSPK